MCLLVAITHEMHAILPKVFGKFWLQRLFTKLNQNGIFENLFSGKVLDDFCVAKMND